MDRCLTPELMDDPAIDAREHQRALWGLARLNRLSRAAQILWPAVREVAQRRGGTVSLLDIATGAGDLPIALAQRAAATGMSLDVHACDCSAVALDVARSHAAAVGIDLKCWEQDVIHEPLAPRGQFDVVTCSLFLHHLDTASAISLLRNAASACRDTLLVSDLRRDRIGLLLAWTVPRAFTRSRIVHIDAVKSVRAALTPSELLDLASQAGLGAATVVNCSPRRMLLSWSRH
jgi:2-polyprenyl-3-methyl-5-hydroxy-6-metoxy-1,4-benzoquinol methylase